MHPSNSGSFVTCAYFPQTTRPVVVTKPNSLTLTSITVPLVMTPREVYMADEGFFLTPKISRQNVAFSSGCVTWAFFMRKPLGRINLSYLGGFRVKFGSTKVIFVTTRFQAFFFRFPDACTRNISSSATALTCAERRGRSTRSEWPQNKKRNHPRRPLLETTRIDGVKAPRHRGTPRSHLRDRDRPLTRFFCAFLFDGV